MSVIVIHEVGMRDGLQMEKSIVPMETKLKWIDKLVESGVDIIQIGSFVNPERMPQMADTDAIFPIVNEKWRGKTQTKFSGLVLNEKGLERAIKADVDLICMGVSASETHSKKNTGMSTKEAITRIIAMAKSAKSDGRDVQVSVQSAFGCGFEGKIDSSVVFSIVDSYLAEGLTKISLADTAGHAHPKQVECLFSSIRKSAPTAELACHFHNTYGLGMANVFAAFESGVDYFESAFGGLGGCPFTKTASGNVATEDLIYAFHKSGLRKEINLDVLIELAKDVSKYFDRELPGYIYKFNDLNSVLY